MDIIRSPEIPWLEMKINRDEPEYSRRRHSHEELSLGIIDEGTTVVEIGALHHNLIPRDTIFIPSGIIHLCAPQEDSIFRFRMFYFDAVWFERAFSLPVLPLQTSEGTLSESLYEQSLDISRKLIDLEGPSDLFETESEIISFLGSILKDLNAISFDKNSPSIELEIVKDVMDKEFKKQLTLDYLSNQTGMSKFSFIRAFKKEYHLPPHAYIVNKRIEFCRQLLKKGNRDMADIALEAGFTDQSHFTKTFRQYVGTPPGEYR
jgi:AraC-like DNA-binding protein